MVGRWTVYALLFMPQDTHADNIYTEKHGGEWIRGKSFYYYTWNKTS